MMLPRESRLNVAIALCRGLCSSALFRVICVSIVCFSNAELKAADWPRFRGPAGSGIAPDSDNLPSVWSPAANLAWKTALPGPGASSPIIVGGTALVTCYSGYGLDRTSPGQIEDLVRHLVCVDMETGKIRWKKDVPASLPEDPYDKSGVSSHGYASHTPCSDGTNVYCFFGKGGVYAFDLNGNELWNTEAGKESDPPRWGSASSPILFGEILVVTAAAECQSIIGFDKATGKKLWQQEAAGLDGMWGTPSLVRIDEGRTDLVMLVAREVWGLAPENGQLRWFAEATSSGQAYTSIISQGPRIFAFSGAGSVGLELNANGIAKEPRSLWRGRVNGIYSSPVRHNSKLYVVSRGILTVVDAKTGKRVKQIRLENARITGNARFGALDYASPVVVGDRLFFLNASGQTYVFDLGEDVQQLAINETTTDSETFWGSPAVSNGRMILRSSKHLYCIAEKVESTVIRESHATNSNDAVSQIEESDRAQLRRRPDPERTGRYVKQDNIERPSRPRRPVSVRNVKGTH